MIERASRDAINASNLPDVLRELPPVSTTALPPYPRTILPTSPKEPAPKYMCGVLANLNVGITTALSPGVRPRGEVHPDAVLPSKVQPHHATSCSGRCFCVLRLPRRFRMPRTGETVLGL
ncbi:hypothetical protein MBAV_003500 [Candidatus Magnetobacterium bavaricum]|uniref:Uncharacterized protein n=1 Tax=Candidatus Magnetobacterium bavaricum TaxID=29290 RepID=A0A0F3GQS0_9BACT|nr:hypothetical protein MBAV_003500 [Candidatus Magnetobacterium bavaricum]